MDNQRLITHTVFYGIFPLLCNILYSDTLLHSRSSFFLPHSYWYFPGFILNNSTLSKKNHAFPILPLIVCLVTSNLCDLYTVHIVSTLPFLLVFPLDKSTTLKPVLSPFSALLCKSERLILIYKEQLSLALTLVILALEENKCYFPL